MSSAQEETIEGFCKRLGVTMSAERITPVPTPAYARGTGPNRPWICMQCDTRLDPIKGTGLKRIWGKPGYVCEGCEYLQITDKDAETRYRMTFGIKGSKHTFESSYWTGSGHVFSEPDMADVLHCLRSDARGFLYHDVDDFIVEYNYTDPDGFDHWGGPHVGDFIVEYNYTDPDGFDHWGGPLAAIRRGEADYRTCGETYRKLVNLLGAAEAAHLIENVEEM